MNTCQNCKYWSRLPDKVFQPWVNQKPHGPPRITVYGECSEIIPNTFGEPAEDGLVFGAYNCADHDDVTVTGPKFGCIHFESKS